MQTNLQGIKTTFSGNWKKHEERIKTANVDYKLPRAHKGNQVYEQFYADGNYLGF